MRRVLTSTTTLIWLAVVVPLLALLAAQFEIGCESGCSLTREIVGGLVLPLVVGWLVVVAVLLGLLWRRWTASGAPKRRNSRRGRLHGQ
jgi:hypothetical protein